MSGKMKTSQEIKYIKGYLNLDYSTVYIFGEFVSSSVIVGWKSRGIIKCRNQISGSGAAGTADINIITCNAISLF